MAQLSKKIELYAEANSVSNIDFTKDVILEDIGDGPYIKEWNLDINQPTDSQLASYETAGNTAETNANIDITRQSHYVQLETKLKLYLHYNLSHYQSID